jgi:hypothetical protein
MSKLDLSKLDLSKLDLKKLGLKKKCFGKKHIGCVLSSYSIKSKNLVKHIKYIDIIEEKNTDRINEEKKSNKSNSDSEDSGYISPSLEAFFTEYDLKYIYDHILVEAHFYYSGHTGYDISDLDAYDLVKNKPVKTKLDDETIQFELVGLVLESLPS